MSPPTASPRVRVLLADDEPSIRAALADIVVDATSGHQAVQLVDRLRPDVAVVDVRMPGGDGFEAAHGIRDASPATAVLALSANDDRDSVLRMLRAGAVGYMVKGTGAAAVVEGIRRAAARRPTLSTEATAHVLDEAFADFHRAQEEGHLRQEREQRVRRLLHGEGLRLVFQPIMDLAQHRIVGYEALARFDVTPARRPDQCFAEAGLVGLRTELELRAIQLGLHALADIPDGAYLSVNASPQTIAAPALADLLAQAPRGRVVVEVTEHAPIEDYGAFARHIDRLRAGGVRLAVDDVGAGFSSLQHVLRLAPEFIKLDLEITREVDQDRRFTALAAALAGFAQETGAALVAEGIETEDQLRILKRLGVALGQGYLLGRPGDLPVHACPVGSAPWDRPGSSAPRSQQSPLAASSAGSSRRAQGELAE